jgi:hypothetical protein
MGVVLCSVAALAASFIQIPLWGAGVVASCGLVLISIETIAIYGPRAMERANYSAAK